MPHFGATHLSVKNKFPRPPVYISYSLTGLVFVGQKSSHWSTYQVISTWPSSPIWKIALRNSHLPLLLNHAQKTSIRAAFNFSSRLASFDATDGRLKNGQFGSSYSYPVLSIYI